MGVSWQDFWKMNPRIVKLIVKGHEEKIKKQDYLAWLFNQYTLSAVSVAVEHCLFGTKAKSEYIKRPIFREIELEQNGYKESNEDVAIYEMKIRAKALEKQGMPESPL